jgi:hypothetical protein
VQPLTVILFLRLGLERGMTKKHSRIGITTPLDS